MNKISQYLSVAGLTALLAGGSLGLLAQEDTNAAPGGRRNRAQGGQGGPGGNFDPAQMRQRMMDRYREQFGVKDDAEWKIISERIEAVSNARRDVGARGGFPGGRGGGPGGPGGAPGGGRGGFGGEPSPEATALQSAIENNASADDIKAKLAKYRESQKDKEAKLAKAQDGLRQILSVKQEAAAVLAGLLK